MSPLLRGLARVPQVRNRVINLICRLEGGQMWSRTYRELMRQYYNIEIGAYSYGDSLRAKGLPEGTRIGNFCSIAQGLTVFRRNHPVDRFSQHPFFYNATLGLLEDDTIETVRDNPLEIGHDVWIGTRVTVTPASRVIGMGAVVAAGAVVTRDVSPFTVVAGVPARPVRERFPRDVQQVLLDSEWWKCPMESLVAVLPLFLAKSTLEQAVQLRDYLKGSKTLKP